ncbi:hypothetical protein [Lacihabitans soyangensis]|uniref:Uncharacterized protein n=1 Tax=Lacihabitans soyangensis TaxID=869394 RepID=A0AAE3GZX9_9BACT|nr:hypothetical protein [Lacihabitans soyangensis]MCP9761486.1 hypothetical protein [Lacihabitans soyangensis]
MTDLRLAKSTAPFTTNKDNFLDALILYSSAEYLKDKLSLDFARAIFVSNNYLEFATKDNDKEFHPDILNIIGETDLTYNRHLKNVVSLSEDLIAEMDYFLNYKIENYDFYCQSCEENQYYSPGGNFDSQIRVSDDRDEFDDPNQLKLFEFDEINVKNFPHLKFVNKGKCFFCGETHICCPECSNVMIDPDDSREDMKTVANEKGFNFEYLHDADQKISFAYGAIVNTHTVILVKEKGVYKIAYIGAIDDNRDETKITTKYVETAIASILAKEEIKTKTSIAKGCTITYRK